MQFEESEILELKRSTSELKEAIISVVAILNKHQRGELYFGIRNDGAVVGQMVSDKTIRDISKAVSDHIEPKIFPVIRKTSFRGKDCIHIEFSGNNTPYYAYGRAYIRVGDSDRKLSAKEIEKIILEKHKDTLRWDNKICDKASLKDISSAKLKSFLKICKLPYSNKENSLDKLGLIQDGRLLNSAVILFGKNPSRIFPNAKLRCAVFGRTDTAFIIDRQEYAGDLFYLIEKAEAYIMEHIHIGMKLDGLYRVDVPEIDRDAFREAVINAFCHRDYNKYDSVNIAVFKDRLEIRNPGRLYGGLSIKQIKTRMVSQRRNELIADIFHRGHFVERWGRGISLILSKEPTTEFEEIGELFCVTFKRKNYDVDLSKDEFISLNDLKNDLNDLKNDLRKRYDLTDNQVKILGAVMQNKTITQQQLSEIVGITPKNIRNNMEKLKEKGILKRIGPLKGGHWQILPDLLKVDDK